MSPVRPLQMQSDARLVELVRAGHERAFDALVRRYRRQLLAYAGRLLGAEGRAEDALQQALLKAWIALRDGAEIDDVRAWLYRIVHNSAVTILRRAQLDCVELNDALDAAAPESGPESRLVLREMLSSVAALPELQRRAILLTAVSGSSHGEAAKMLGLSDGAVRGLVYRARASIRDAAAGLLPVGAFHWLTGLGQRRSSAAGRIAELAGAAGGTGSAGVFAAVLKGGAIVVSAGALATAGQLAIPYASTAPHHAAPASVHATGQPGSAARRAAVGSSASASASVSVSLAASGRDRVGERGGRPAPRRGDRDGGRGAGGGHAHRGGDGLRGSGSGHGSADGSGESRTRGDSSGSSGGTPGAGSSGDSEHTSTRGTSNSGGEPSGLASGAGGAGGGSGSGGGTSGSGGGTSTAGSGTSTGGSGKGGGAPGGGAGDGAGTASGSSGPGRAPGSG